MASSNTRFLCCRGQALDVLSCYTSLWRIISDTAKVSMPSRAWVVTINEQVLLRKINVSMPSRAYTSFLQINEEKCPMLYNKIVSMPSRAYTSFLHITTLFLYIMIPCFNALSGLYLISTLIKDAWTGRYFRVSMPSRAYTSFLQHCSERFYMNLINVSMPSRAYTSFLRYPFKNLGFMRFPEPVFAGIYQNILTAAVFRAC